MSAYALDVTDDSFQQHVIDASHDHPVLVDFWAAWCGPCRVLKPILEKLAAEGEGRFTLAKVNADENPAVSAQFGIRSLPTVMAFLNGEVADEFMGALPESQVRGFIEGVLPGPGELLRREGQALLESGQSADAVTKFEAALALEPRSDAIRIGLAQAYVATGRAADAGRTVETVGPLGARESDLAQALAAVRMTIATASGPGEPELRQRLSQDPSDVAARLALAQHLAAAGRMEAALDEFLEVIRRDRKFGDDAGRRGMIQVFDLLGPSDPVVGKYRKLLAGALH